MTLIKKEKEYLNPPAVADMRHLAFNQAVKVGNIIFLSGQGITKPGDIEAQTVQAFENIKAILESVGATMDDVVKLTTFVKRGPNPLGDFKKIQDVRRRYWPKGSFPAATGVIVDVVAGGDERALVEVDAIAVV